MVLIHHIYLASPLKRALFGEQRTSGVFLQFHTMNTHDYCLMRLCIE